MTREEAIEQFQNCIELIKQDGKDWLDDRDIPMLNMAIEALQAKTDGDTISRQDAVSEIHKYFFEEICKTPVAKDEDGYEVYTDMPTVNALLKRNKELSKRIKSLPSAVCDDCIWRVCNYNKVDWDADVVSKGVFDQVKWERDTALKTLEEHGIGFGERADRPTGEWISNHDGSWNCSECGLRVFVYAKGNFCPNCGAKMEGGNSE